MFKQQVIIVFLVLIACIAGNSVSSDPEQCPEICPEYYEPVCGTNGIIFKEYSNSCKLLVDSCREERNNAQTYKQVDLAWCRSEVVENLREKLGNLNLDDSDCLQACPMIYKPVCVTNGTIRGILSNPCITGSYNCALQKAGAQNLLRHLQGETCDYQVDE